MLMLIIGIIIGFLLGFAFGQKYALWVTKRYMTKTPSPRIHAWGKIINVSHVI